MRQKLIRCIDGVNNVLAYIASFMLLASTLIVVVDAALRFVGFGGLTWAAEASNILVILMVYLMMPYMEFNDKQLSVGILTSLVKNKVALKIITLIRGLVTLALSGVLVVNFIKLCKKAIKYHYVTTVIELPRIYLFGIITACLILVVLSWLGVIFLKRCSFLGGSGKDAGADGGGAAETEKEEGRGI